MISASSFFPTSSSPQTVRSLAKALSIVLVLVSGSSSSVWAKPVDASRSLETFQYLDLKRRASDHMGTATDGTLNISASAGTTWYGGTTWDPVDGRWESLMGQVWTFDSGVGSVIMDAGQTGADFPGVTGNATPRVNPFKAGGLHALMEGWVGLDKTYSELTYLRLLSSNDARWAGSALVGAAHFVAPNVLSGSRSWYCGVFKEEADNLCYASGGGYGNSWRVCLGKTVNTTGASVTLDFNLVWESESDYDFTSVEIDTTTYGAKSDIVTAAVYDGMGGAHQSLTLVPGVESRSDAGPIQVRFCFTSDGAWSDEDGLNPTVAGAFSIDDIGMTGGVNSPVEDFELSPGGWARLPAEPGVGGEWSRLALIDDLPPYLTACTCDLVDSVLVFEDLAAGGHGRYQDNVAVSPWIEFQPGGDGPGKFVELHLYSEMPLLNYMFMQIEVQWYPAKCKDTGLDLVSAWTSTGFVFYLGGVPTCTIEGGAPATLDFSTLVPETATQMRIALGMISVCAYNPDCSGVSNYTPAYDQVALGVFGQGGAPLITSRGLRWPLDNFPANGTLRLDAPVRFDAGGDTLVVEGATGGAEVHVNLAVSPGPFINQTELSYLYNRLTFAGTSNGRSFYTARMDTAEFGESGALDGRWMTAYHEEDPNFQGFPHPNGDRQLDPDDLGSYPAPGVHLLNDIFPDALFTPGTRVDLFYRAKYDGETAWFVYPDTTGGNYIEWEAFPSSAHTDSTWNCVLYVDHFDGWGAQPYIENGLGLVLGYTGNNFEGTNWDRYDVRAPSTGARSFGRPLGAAYGASVIQALGYDCIVWNGGSIPSFNLVKRDADVLIPYLTLLGFPGNSLWVSGDDAATSMTEESASNPSSLLLLNTVMGAAQRTGCTTFRDAACPNGGDPQDTTACVYLDPVAAGPVADPDNRTVFHRGQGNGCPQTRSFDVLEPFTPIHGFSWGDEAYRGNLKSAQFASVASEAAGGMGVPTYKTLIDGISAHHRRDDGTPCDFAAGGTTSVDERVAEFLVWAGYAAAQGCSDRTAATGAPIGLVRPAYRTMLSNFAPNPLLAGRKGRITFTMEKEGPANIAIIDVTGRLVKTVFQGIAGAGPNEVAWDGTDATGRHVASGVYFYRLRVDSKTLSKKMVVVRSGGD